MNSKVSAYGHRPPGYVNALAVSGGALYAGGFFTTVTNSGDVAVTVNHIGQWNGSSWSPLGSGMDGLTSCYVNALAVSGGTNANYIAQWNGSSWSPLGSGMNGSCVLDLAVSGGTLYAGGNFTAAGGTIANYIAQWNGSNWSPLGAGMDYVVEALAVLGGTLYAGGDFTTAGGTPANYIAQWSGSSWSASPPGSGMGGGDPSGPSSVYALAMSGGTLYAAGNFTAAGGTNANYIAQWNGSSWSPLGSGLGNLSYPYGGVGALAVSAGTLYVGGDFTTAGGNAANHIAQWNGSSWLPLGSGMDKRVLALAVSGGTLYAGGEFTTAGGITAYHIAQWNGSSWSPLGSGLGAVYALAVSGTNLYAGGDFVSATPSGDAICIARWNGINWSPLSLGTGGSVYALAVSGTNLYAGGELRTAGGYFADYIARWNGSGWSTLGSGMNYDVYALAVSGGTLYASGAFTRAGGNVANYIAQWNGSSWSPLGSGMGGEYPSVTALAVSGNTLYAGGYFTTAGGKVSPYAAQAILFWPEFQSNPVHNTDGSMTLGCSTASNYPSRLYAATNLAPPVVWQPVCTNLTGGLWQFTDTNASGHKAEFYRLSTP